MTRLHLRLALAGALAAAGLAPATAAPRVAADIAPVQSIVARVMQGVGDPGLIMPPGASPHDYALKPSEARLLQDADLVVWVGPALTPWLAGPIEALATHATVLALQDAPGIVTLPARGGADFEPDLDEVHAAAEETRTDAAPTATIDGHLWLDPANGAAAARAVAAALAALDPGNAAAYAANATAFADELAALTDGIAAQLAPVRDERFFVFHDAFQYFEHRFGVSAAGSISLQDGVMPGTARVAQIQERVRADDIACAFTEPQFEPKLLATVIEGTDVRTGVLDDLGAALPPGPALYPALLQGLADSVAGCLGG